MEFLHPIEDWNNLRPITVDRFKKFRDPDPQVGRKLLIEQNVFVEHVLQAGVIRELGEEMSVYRRPFLQPESREPIYRFPNELPIASQPANVWELAQDYMAWLLASERPKLFFWATPGAFVWEAKAKEFMGKLKNTRAVYLGAGVHYVQEDHPHKIGRELADWLTLS